MKLVFDNKILIKMVLPRKLFDDFEYSIEYTDINSLSVECKQKIADKISMSKYMYKTALRIKDIELIKRLDELDIIPVKEAVNMAVEYGNLEAIDFLYSKNHKYEFDTMSTYIAAEHADLDMLKKLKSYGVSLPIFLPNKCYMENMVRRDVEFLSKMREVVDYLVKHNVKILFRLEVPSSIVKNNTSLRKLLL